MKNSVRFACTSLKGTNKVGILPVDENGYRTMIVGALNMFNSAGELYVAQEAKELFEGSSAFMRRVARGVLKAEYGHPKLLPGQSERSFAARVLNIDEDRVCAHHKELWLQDMTGPDGRPVLAIMSKVGVSGPFGATLERSLNNKDENVCFSIRAFTDDRMIGGINHRTLRQIITFDYVNEPGMSVAEKFKSPALEAFGKTIIDPSQFTTDYERTITRSMLEAGLAEDTKNGVATESVLLTAADLYRTMGWGPVKQEAPIWSKW